MTLRIVVPDGPLWAPSLELLAAADRVGPGEDGFPVRVHSRLEVDLAPT